MFTKNFIFKQAAFLCFMIILTNLVFSKEVKEKYSLNLRVKPIPSKPMDSANLCSCAKGALKKARSGDVEAMVDLANCYIPVLKSSYVKEEKELETCSPSDELRFAWLGAAATRGFAPAQYEYGLLYMFGVGVAEDKVNAGNWIVLAAAQNYPPACFTLGEIYQYGLGRPKDLLKAMKCFEVAASLGELRAKIKLKEFKAD